MNCPKCDGLTLTSGKSLRCTKCDHTFDPFYPWSKVAPTTGGFYWLWDKELFPAYLNPYSNTWWHGEARFYPNDILYGPRILEPRNP